VFLDASDNYLSPSEGDENIQPISKQILKLCG